MSLVRSAPSSGMDEPASSNRWMKPIVGRCYFDASRDLPDKSWLQGQNMSKTTLIAIAVLAIGVGCAEAKHRNFETATLGKYANSKNLPVCTASSSLFEVLGDKCFLVTGSMIYGDIAELSGTITLNW
ncbi:hypothetical protein NKH16_24435 [Mesorhizobium sp. M1307]|uniref:hypothetical protein n=1 Tax=Mesorhizobium sp. M1307 TaxID=2957079 RepID=UPI0033353A5C